jgi:hypothetical protein
MKSYLLTITLIAVLLGVTLSIATRGQYSRRELSKDEFLVQCQRASNIPIGLGLPRELRPKVVDAGTASVDLPPSCRGLRGRFVRAERSTYLRFTGKESDIADDTLWFSGTIQSCSTSSRIPRQLRLGRRPDRFTGWPVKVAAGRCAR